MRLYQNKVLLFVFILVLSTLSILLFFDDSNFLSNNIISSNAVVNTRVNILPAEQKNCSVQLSTGWNMVSFYCLGLFNERSIVLQSVSESYGAIFKYQSSDVTDPWKSYNPNLPNWTVQQLNYMDRTSGYWIYMTNDTTFFYSGVYSNSVIPLYSGWNFVGYPNLNSTNISVALSEISFSVVDYYNKSTGTWLVYYYGGSSNTLNNFNTYKGYWINVSSISQWNITRG